MSGMEWRRAGGPAGGRAGGGRGGERRPQRGEDRRPRGEDRRPPRRKRASSLPISEISVGDAFSGVVSEMGRHGAFITVTDGSGRSRDGLLRRPQREYREGDRVSVSVAAVNAEKEQIDLRETGGAEGAPARRAEMNPDAASFVPGAAAADPPSSAPAQGERKLLILDLNGVLGARVPYHMRSHSSSKFQKRPHCDAFLRFCFDNFDVAVWSCAAREKMELFLFTEEQRAALRFVFHQKHSRNLWPRFSSVSSQKPLFLKDLAHSLPSHDLSRVLLLDNHAEKFEGNPLGSCLAVPEYAFAPGGASRDDVLSPQGELTARLSALRDADSAAYMASNPCAFFPTSHPAPQPLPCGPPPPPVLLKDVGDCFCGLKALRESRLFRDVRADKFVSRSVEVPQPRASSLRRRDLGELLREPYVAAEKTDGTRAALVVHPAGFAVLLQRNLQAEVHPDGPRLAQLLCANKMGLSVLDGELVQATLAGEAGARRVFLCFDAVVLSGREVATTPSLLQRLKGVRDAIGGDAVVEGMALPLLLKRFHAAGEVGALLACLSPSGGLPGMLTYADGERSSDCDGLILTPSRRQYFLSNSYKFKPHELITIDLKVQPQHARRELQRLRSGEARELRVLATTFRKGSKEDVDLLGVLMDEATAEAIASHRGRGAVVECAFDSAGARGWHALRLRHDKARPNSLGTCWRALESIAERLTAEEIASHLKDNVGAVASHYDARQRERNERGRPDADNPIFQLRKLNNFVKALLLNKCAELLEGDGDRGAGGALTGADPLPPERCGAVPEALRGTGGGPRRDRARARRRPRRRPREVREELQGGRTARHGHLRDGARGGEPARAEHGSRRGDPPGGHGAAAGRVGHVRRAQREGQAREDAPEGLRPCRDAVRAALQLRARRGSGRRDARERARPAALEALAGARDRHRRGGAPPQDAPGARGEGRAARGDRRRRGHRRRRRRLLLRGGEGRLRQRRLRRALRPADRAPRRARRQRGRPQLRLHPRRRRRGLGGGRRADAAARRGRRGERPARDPGGELRVPRPAQPGRRGGAGEAAAGHEGGGAARRARALAGRVGRRLAVQGRPPGARPVR